MAYWSRCGRCKSDTMCLLQEQRIKELEESLNKCQNVQPQVKGYNLFIRTYNHICVPLFNKTNFLRKVTGRRLWRHCRWSFTSCVLGDESGHSVGGGGRKEPWRGKQGLCSHRMNPRLPESFQPLAGRPDQDNVLMCLVFSLFSASPLSQKLSWTDNSRRQLKGWSQTNNSN